MTQNEIEEIVKEIGMDFWDTSDKETMFILEYLKSFNIKQSAINAGYSKSSAAHYGKTLLNKEHIKRKIEAIKEKFMFKNYVTIDDIIEQYRKIAFADISDYVKFGQREFKDKKGNIRSYNYVDLMEYDECDTSIIAEVKEGKDGVSIKLHDKMKALEKLEKYLDAIPDKHKRMLEIEKLKLEKTRVALEIEKLKGTGSNNELAESVNDKMKDRKNG